MELIAYLFYFLIFSLDVASILLVFEVFFVDARWVAFNVVEVYIKSIAKLQTSISSYMLHVESVFYTLLDAKIDHYSKYNQGVPEVVFEVLLGVMSTPENRFIECIELLHSQSIQFVENRLINWIYL